MNEQGYSETSLTNQASGDTAASVKSVKAAKGTRRNERERRRVQNVNRAFVKLRQHIPQKKRYKRLSKVKTLQKAIEYIHQLQDLLVFVDGQQPAETGSQADARAAPPEFPQSHHNVPMAAPNPVMHQVSLNNTTTGNLEQHSTENAPFSGRLGLNQSLQSNDLDIEGHVIRSWSANTEGVDNLSYDTGDSSALGKEFTYPYEIPSHYPVNSPCHSGEDHGRCAGRGDTPRDMNSLFDLLSQRLPKDTLQTLETQVLSHENPDVLNLSSDVCPNNHQVAYRRFPNCHVSTRDLECDLHPPQINVKVSGSDLDSFSGVASRTPDVCRVRVSRDAGDNTTSRTLVPPLCLPTGVFHS